MPPTGGSGRRGMLPPGESQYAGKAMTYVGMAAAALGAIAGGFNLYEKHKDQFISGPPRSMPRRIERQILAGSSPDDDDDDSSPMLMMGNGGRKSWRNTTSSHAVAGNEDLSSEHLRFIQEEYKEELNESKEEGDWERAADISKTLGMIQQVLGMRDEVSHASQVGDIQRVSATSSKLGKVQRALQQRLNDEYAGRALESASNNYDESSTPTKMEPSSYGDCLSKEELIALRAQLEAEMKSVDTSAREGMAEWRLRFKRVKIVGETLDILDAIDVAEDEDDDKELRDRLSFLQEELFSEAPKVPAASEKKGFLGLFRGARASSRADSGAREKKAPNEKKRPAPESKAPPQKKIAGRYANARRRSTRSQTEACEETTRFVGTTNSKAASQMPPKKKNAGEKRAPGYDYLDIGEDVDRYKFSSISPYIMPWNLDGESPEAPSSREDVTPSSLAFTSPFGDFELPPNEFISSNVIGFDSPSSLRRFVGAAKEIVNGLDWSADESLIRLQEHLPTENNLTLNQLRHLYRNFADSRSIKGRGDEINLSRREFDIFTFCKKRGLTTIDALAMMPYRDLNGIERIWKDLDEKVSLDLRQSTSYDIELKSKVGLLMQLEKNRPCRTSSGRTTQPPAAFVAGPASRKGNDDTIAGSRADVQLSTSDKLPSTSFATTTTATATAPSAAATSRDLTASSSSSSVTSQTKTKESRAPKPDFVELCPEYGPGWIVKGYERKSGTQKGHFDKYWFSPCGKKLRSRKEVERFLKDDVAANVEGPATNTSNKESRETYVIEKILGRKLNPSNERTEYLIRWKGYPNPTDFTFEPIENLGRRHVDEPETRWGDSEADPGKIEVNDMQRDGKDVLLYAKLMNLETDAIEHDGDNDDDEEDQYNEEEEQEEEELNRGSATAQDGMAELLNQTAISIDNQVQVSVASVASAASAPSDTHAEIGASLSPESETLYAASPVDEEDFQLDEASISSEATRDDTGLLLP